jgi:hypothetical protein
MSMCRPSGAGMGVEAPYHKHPAPPGPSFRTGSQYERIECMTRPQTSKSMPSVTSMGW